MIASVEWDERRTDVQTVTELNDLIDALHASASSGQAILVEVVRSSGDSMMIGLGRGETVLSFTPASLEPPYFASRGARIGADVVTFESNGEPTEFPVDQLVSMDHARAALKTFVETGELAPNVEWQEV